jgi:hypothetical protein
MATVEKRLEAKLKREVKKLDGEALKISSMFYTGLPDRIVLMPGGKLYWVELKSTGKKPTPRQLLVHRLLRGLGFKVYVIDNDGLLTELILELKRDLIAA